MELAISRAGFEDIALVLNAMQEHDIDLVHTISALKVAKGSKAKIDFEGLSEKIEILPPFISLKALRQGIYVKFLDRIGFRWDEMYGRLLTFYNDHGHSRVPTQWRKDPQLVPGFERSASLRGR